MPGIFQTIDKLKPAYDITYKIVLVICKLLLVVDILITTMSVIGRYVPFVPDPAWSEEVVLTCMAYMAVLSAALSRYSCGCLRLCAGCCNAGSRLAVCRRNRREGNLRQHAVSVEILDVFPDAFGGSRNDCI